MSFIINVLCLLFLFLRLPCLVHSAELASYPANEEKLSLLNFPNGLELLQEESLLNYCLCFQFKLNNKTQISIQNEVENNFKNLTKFSGALT